MKTIFSLIGIIIISKFSLAQSYTVKYDERINIENQLKEITDIGERERMSAYLSKPRVSYLYYDNGESLYVKEKKMKDNPLNIADERENGITIAVDEKESIYKNFKTKEYLSETNLFGKQLLIVDKLEKINWLFTKEEKTIGSLKCKKAMANVNSEDVIAWYNDEIAIQDGPRDYYGLPGLIIELITTAKTYHAINISQTKDKFVIQKPSKGKVISKDEYSNEFSKALDNLANSFQSSQRAGNVKVKVIKRQNQ